MNETQAALPNLALTDFKGHLREKKHNKGLATASNQRAVLRRHRQPIGEYAYGGACGYLYSARSYARTIKSSRTVTVYLSLNDEPLEFLVRGERFREKVAVFKPLVARTVVDHGCGFVCAVLNPMHPGYRQFAIAPSAKVTILSRDTFSLLDEEIRDACLGYLDLESGLQLLSKIVSTAATGLPVPEAIDPRVAAAIDLLRADANISFVALASEVGLSYFRLSHLFSQCIGLSLRSYQMWLKLDYTWRLIERGCSVEEIVTLAGFSDLAHLCHVFHDTYGVPIAQHLRNLSAKVSFTPT